MERIVVTCRIIIIPFLIIFSRPLNCHGYSSSMPILNVLKFFCSYYINTCSIRRVIVPVMMNYKQVSLHFSPLYCQRYSAIVLTYFVMDIAASEG